MIDFAPGMRTIIRDEEWMIKKIETNSLGNRTLYCVGISPLVKDREAIFLTDLEQIQIVNPAEVKLIADVSPFYKRALLYLESQWRQQIPTDANLHIGHKAAMDLMPYQLDPAKLALQRPRQRILIADTVGLGKTLEAGILMSELIARGKGKRILVVTVKSMMTQFQKEMWNRFTIPLVRLDSNRIQKIRANLPSNYNPFFYYDKTIVSIDTLKRDVEYRTHLENAYWDIIVIDEAQNVAERGDHQAQRSRLAKLLADRSDTMIMLSATPHDGRAKSFASLMNMLDPTAIADPQNYTPEDIKGLCIRRFKKDVKDQVSGSFLERKITLERCNASAKEEYAFDIFTEMQLEMDLGKTKGTGQLFKTSLEKSLFSSPAACIKSIEARLKKLYKKYTADDIKDIHLLENLKTALEAITPADFTRYQKLLDLLKSKEYAWNPADSGDRVVIFTERIETMKYLAERLRQDLGLKANAIQEISGGMSDAEQQRIVEDFGRTESSVRVLVASDVASEGLNLHYLSHRLIHFDIPWSLMVFQQRNGRIDRYGQQKRPDIRYINNFLKCAGYKYAVSIEETTEHKYKLLLRPTSVDTKISSAKSHLSYGERNALALALFMFSAIKEDPDMVILDDPITSFDGNKKFALLNMLFLSERCLKNRTVLLLTHDFNTVIDVISTMPYNFNPAPHGAFLSTINGVLEEKEISKANILSFKQIALLNIEADIDILNKAVFLRRLYEAEGNTGLGWNLLSNLFHKREVPTIPDDNATRNMTASEIADATAEIGQYITGFDYNQQYLRTQNTQTLIDAYHNSGSNYEKLQIYRILYNENHENPVVKKFVNETFHVENDFLFQLNPSEYETIPQYIIEECDEDIQSLVH